MIGEILGNRYKILRDIGSGGMAWVYLAEDIQDGSLVAVKVLYPQFSEDMAYVQRFNREAKLASTLSDPHIVRVLDYGAARDIHYLVMEYIEGRDLKSILQEQRTLPYREVLEIARQVAQALEQANQRGIVHRDIKPQNLMLTADGTVKVLDFGIARAGALPSLTQSGFIGSPYYISPEQAMGEEVDIRSDIYSLGIVMYEVLSGDLPFNARSPWSIIRQQISSKPPSLRLRDDNLPEAVDRLINKALAKRPEDRFQTPTELLMAVEAILTSEEMPAEAGPSSPQLDHLLLRSLYQRAVEASQAEEWKRAVDLFHQVLKLQPDFKEAIEGLRKAEREAQLATLYIAAQEAMEVEQWEEAIDRLSEIVAIDASYRDVSRLLTQAGEALSTARAAALYTEGLRYLEAKEWAKAVDCFSRVQRLAPGYQRTEELLTEAQKELKRTSRAEISFMGRVGVVVEGWWERARAGVGKRGEVGRIAGPQRKVLVTVLVIVLALALLGGGTYAYWRHSQTSAEEAPEASYQRGLAALAEGNWKEAIEEFNRVLAVVPGYKDVVERKAEAEQAATQEEMLARLYAEGEAYYRQNQWDEAIARLSEIYRIHPDYEGARVAQQLYEAHLRRGDDRRERGELALALEDYETALEVKVADRKEAQKRWKGLLGQLATLTAMATPLEEVTATATPLEEAKVTAIPLEKATAAATPLEEATATATPLEEATAMATLLEEATVTAKPVEWEYPPPRLVAPANETIFSAGLNEQIILKWEPVERLTKDEFYNVTVLHFYAEEEVYWGDATQETEIRFPPEGGYGESDKDVFYWWVEVRRTTVIKPDGKPDGPAVSPKSEAWTFIWR